MSNATLPLTGAIKIATDLRFRAETDPYFSVGFRATGSVNTDCDCAILVRQAHIVQPVDAHYALWLTGIYSTRIFTGFPN